MKKIKITFNPTGYHEGIYKVENANKELRNILKYISYEKLFHVFSLRRPFSEFAMILERKQKPVTITTNYEELKKELSNCAYQNEWDKAKKKVEKEKRKKEKIVEAKEKKGEVFLWSYSDSCNDPSAQCDVDLVNVYIKPNGTTRKERMHTY